MSGRRFWGGRLHMAAMLVLLVSLWMAMPVMAQSERSMPAVFAQAEDSAANAAESETPSSLPHGKFLLDYLIVLALFAAAIYAVCRSSRRI